MFTLFGTAEDRDRANQWMRLLGLTKPLKELSSDTLTLAYNPATETSWTVQAIKADPEWKAQGNPDSAGETDGYTFAKLRAGEPLSEGNFVLTDVPGNDYERVAKWLRSKLPLNSDRGQGGETWAVREGVLWTINKDGTLPDSNPDAEGNFPVYNTNWWLRVDIDYPLWFEQWFGIYIDADPNASYIVNQMETNTKVGRTGQGTPFYQYPVGAPVLALVDPAHRVQWERLVR